MNTEVSTEVVRYVLGVGLAAFGVGAVVTNIARFTSRVSRSLIPFVGGASLVAAMYVLPVELPGWLRWCPLLIDPGFLFHFVQNFDSMWRRISRSRVD